MSDFERIAIIGPGLLGGSLVHAIRQRNAGIEVRVWGRREEPLASLQRDRLVSIASTSIAEVVSGADLVVLATTIGVMGDWVRGMIVEEALAGGAVVTDVGSVKGSVVEELEPLVGGAGGHFIGSHPMAGSEKKGLEHASADLFEGAACLITPTERSHPPSVDRIDRFWQWLGCRTSRLTPAEHDEAMARISHVPHLVAAILVEAALKPDGAAGAFSGGGFRDTTRIASGSPEMWTEILMENRDAVREALAQFHALTGETLAFLDEMKKEDLHRLLSDARERREQIRFRPAPKFPEP